MRSLRASLAGVRPRPADPRGLGVPARAAAASAAEVAKAADDGRRETRDRSASLFTADFHDAEGALPLSRHRARHTARFRHRGTDFMARHRPEIASDQLAGANGVDRADAARHGREPRRAIPICSRSAASASVTTRWMSAACTAADVLLFIAAGAVDRPVAEATVGWMLALTHHMRTKDRLVREGAVGRPQPATWAPNSATARSASSASAASAGHSCKLLAGFGMKPPLVFDPFVTPADATRLGVTLVPLDELLFESDFVSIHCPLTDADAQPDRRSRTRPDEADRVPHQHRPRRHRGRGRARRRTAARTASPGPPSTASRTNRSPPRRRSRELDNVLLAPHCIAWTDELFRDIGRAVCRGMLDLAEGRVPKGVVNREVLDRPGFQAKWKRIIGSVISCVAVVQAMRPVSRYSGQSQGVSPCARSLALLLLASPVPAADPIVPPDAKLEKIFDGGLVLTEGVAVAPDGMVYFSDITFSHVSQATRSSRSRPGTSGSSTPRPARRRSSARPAACPTASSSTPTATCSRPRGPTTAAAASPAPT